MLFPSLQKDGETGAGTEHGCGTGVRQTAVSALALMGALVGYKAPRVLISKIEVIYPSKDAMRMIR